MSSSRRLAHTIAALAVAALAAAPPAAAEKVLKLGNVQAPGHVVQSGLKRMAELVRERTGGEIKIEVFPASQLGSEQEILEGVQLGTIHMYEGSAASVGRFFAPLEAVACPFLWKSPESLVQVMRGKIGEGLSQELLAQRSLRVLDLGWIFGVRHLTTTRTPVHTPADMKGLKIRVQPDAIYLATVRSLGASPTPIDAQELYTSLQAGVVDGQENPISNIYQRKFQEVQKYLVRTGHITQNQVIIINEDVFQGLTGEQQGTLMQSAREAGDEQNKLVSDAEARDLEKLKAAGMEVIDPDVAAFRTAAGGVCRDPAIEKKLGPGLVERLANAQG